MFILQFIKRKYINLNIKFIHLLFNYIFIFSIKINYEKIQFILNMFNMFRGCISGSHICLFVTGAT